jgi:hypothetical protein
MPCTDPVIQMNSSRFIRLCLTVINLDCATAMDRLHAIAEYFNQVEATDISRNNFKLLPASSRTLQSHPAEKRIS